MVMSVRYSDKAQVFDMYNYRARWLEPFEWNDGRQNTSQRRYHLECWLQNEKGKILKLVHMDGNGK